MRRIRDAAVVHVGAALLDRAPRGASALGEARRLERLDERQARVEGGAWTPVAHGSFERVALAAAAHGMEPLEFTNELGSWRVDIDGRFPMATVRLEGSVVEVRGLR